MVSKLLLMTLVILTQLVLTHSVSFLYVIGGETKNFEPSNSTSHLNTATGVWKAMKNMPTVRKDFCGAVVGTKIYLFGGYISRKPDYTYEMASNDVYDCLTDTYTPLPPMPDYQRVGCSAAVLDQSIYVSGGMKSNYDPTNSLVRFDTTTNQWTRLSPMIRNRANHQLIEISGQLHAIGGDFQHNLTEVYDPTTNKWSLLIYKAVYYIGAYGSAAEHEGKVYAFGRGGFAVFSPALAQCVDPRDCIHPWSSLNSEGPSDEWFRDTKLVSMNDKLWAVGGSINKGRGSTREWKYNENLYFYDVSNNQWNEGQQIDIGRRRRDHSVFVVNL